MGCFLHSCTHHQAICWGYKQPIPRFPNIDHFCRKFALLENFGKADIGESFTVILYNILFLLGYLSGTWKEWFGQIYFRKFIFRDFSSAFKRELCTWARPNFRRSPFQPKGRSTGWMSAWWSVCRVVASLSLPQRSTFGSALAPLPSPPSSRRRPSRNWSERAIHFRRTSKFRFWSVSLDILVWTSLWGL